MGQPDYNPRMPLTTKGIIYALILVALAIANAYFVIRGLGILDDDTQYAVTIGLIVLYICLFFTRDNVLIGLGSRAIWSFTLAALSFLILFAIGLFFQHFFGV